MFYVGFSLFSTSRVIGWKSMSEMMCVMCGIMEKCLSGYRNGLHMVQLMLRPPNHLLFHYNPEWFTFLTPAYRDCSEKEAGNGNLLVCLFVSLFIMCSFSSRTDVYFMYVCVSRMIMTRRFSITIKQPSLLHRTSFCRSSALDRCIYFVETMKTLVCSLQHFIILTVCIDLFISVCSFLCLPVCFCLFACLSVSMCVGCI